MLGGHEEAALVERVQVPRPKDWPLDLDHSIETPGATQDQIAHQDVLDRPRCAISHRDPGPGRETAEETVALEAELLATAAGGTTVASAVPTGVLGTTNGLGATRTRWPAGVAQARVLGGIRDALLGP